MSFEVTPEQQAQFNAWREKKNKKIRSKGELPNNTYTWCFTPTGIGLGLTVKCSDGTEIDLTEYDKW